MKRSAMPSRSVPLRRLTGLAPMSRKRKRLLRERARLRAEVLERDQGCIAQGLFDIECGGPLDVHELIRRSQWADGWLVADNTIVLCRAHHMATHASPERARAAGLLLKGHER